MKKILVMGANGYIGSHFTEYLCKKNNEYDVYASGRKNTNIDKRAKFVQYDIHQEISSEQEYISIFGNPDICVYMTWQDGFNHNSENHMKDLYYHWNFIRHMLDNGLKHLAVMGSFREYGNYYGGAHEDLVIIPDNYYVLAKDTLRKAIMIYKENNHMNFCFQWIRPFSVYGDDAGNNSVFSKIMQWELEGKENFSCTTGEECYDYISISEVVYQIEKIISQTEVDGIINCCTGKPTSLKEQIERFIRENKFKISPKYGEFERRSYDSDCIYGDRTKLNQILGVCDAEFN